MYSTERELIIHLDLYQSVLKTAAETYDPSIIANYAYDLAKLYNKLYNELPILTASLGQEKLLRVILSKVTGDTIRKAMSLLGIEVPEKM